MFAYLHLRRQVFKHEVKHLRKQIEQFMLLTFVFLGTALPAFFFAVLLAFGIVLDNESSVSQTLLIVWAIIVTQSLILLLFKQAILGSRYTLFLHAFERANVNRYACDLILAIVCNPILLMYLVVIGSIDFYFYKGISHAFLLLYMLVSSMLIAIYKTHINTLFLAIALLCIPLVNNLSLNAALIALCASQLICLVLARFTPLDRFSLSRSMPAPLYFWLSLCTGSPVHSSSRSNHKNSPLLASVAFAILFIIMADYSAQELPQYSQVVYMIAAQFVVLACASIQLTTSKIMRQHNLFFAMYCHNSSISVLQYWVSFAAAVIMLTAAALVFGNALVMVYCLPALISIIFAKHSPRLFLIIWLSACLLTGVLVLRL